MSRHISFRVLLGAAALSASACDHPTDLPGPVPATAGSFGAPYVCGAVLESASGGIYTISPSYPTIQVDFRSANGTIVWWSKALPTLNPTCTGAVAPSGNPVISTGDTVFSLNAKTGAVRWRFAVGSGRAVWLATSSTGKIFLIARDDNASVPGAPETLYALSDADGSVLWSRVLDRAGRPYVDDARSTVYYVRHIRVVAMDIGSGAVKWDTGTDGGGYSAIASDGSLLIGKLHPEGNFLTDPMYYEIDALAPSGTRTWQSAKLAVTQYLSGPPIIDDAGTSYSATTSNQALNQSGASVYAISVATGDMKWKHDFYRIKSTLAVDANRTVYVIAQAAADSSDQIYGLREGVTVSASTPAPRDLYVATPLTIHSNKLLYYPASNMVGYIPTAGVSPAAAWPMDSHDAKQSGAR